MKSKKFLTLACVIACLALCASFFTACGKSGSGNNEEIIGSADSSANVIVSSDATQSSETTQQTTTDDGKIDENEAKEIAAQEFKDYDLSVVGNPDREKEFATVTAQLQKPSDDPDSPDPNNQFADMQQKEVWVIKYLHNDSESSFVYFVIDPDSGDILDSGFMGD